MRIQILGEIINKHMTVVCEKVVSRCCSITSGPFLHLTQCAATEAFHSRAPSDLTRTWTAPHVVLVVAENCTPFKYFTTKQDHAVSRYGAGIEHLRQHFFRSSYPCQLVTRLRCVYRGARMLTGNTCAMHQVLKFLLAKWLFKVICYSFTL